MHGFDMSIPPGHLVESESDAKNWLDYFIKAAKIRGSLGLDTETTGLHKTRDRPIVWSLSDGQQRICLPIKYALLFKEPILENPAVGFDFTNAKFDAHMLRNVGIDVSKAGRWCDTLVQSWLFNENNQGRHGLKECIQDHFGRTTPTFEQTFGKPSPARRHPKLRHPITQEKLIIKEAITVGDLIQRAFADPVKRHEAADYSSLDAYNSTALREYFDQRLRAIIVDPATGRSLWHLFYEIEVPFTKLLWKMERRGITCDYGYLKAQAGPMGKDLDEITAEVTSFMVSNGYPELFNINSNPQIQKLFFGVLKKPVIKETKGGASGIPKPSIDADVLDEWAGQGDPWAMKLLKYRSIAKIKSTYVDSLQEHVTLPGSGFEVDMRIHTTLNQIGTVTGRLSSNDPNLQNIPRPGEDKWRIREAFIAGEGCKLIVADYSQLEMRLMAHFSGDEKMIDAIKKDIDLHCLTVSEMYGIPYDEVNGAKKAEKLVKNGKRPEPLTEREEELLFYRQAAKATGFGIIYGIGGPHLAHNLTQELKKLVTPEEGEQLIQKWFGVFPRVQQYIQWVQYEMGRKGYVQTILGYLRRFGDIRSMDRQFASRANRQGPNAVIQGSAAAVAKSAMLSAENDAELGSYGAKLLLQIHDELIWDCPEQHVMVAKKRVKELMESPFLTELKVPLPVEVGSGDTWADAK